MAGVKVFGYNKAIASMRAMKKWPTRPNMARIGNVTRSAFVANYRGNPLGWPDIKEETKRRKGSSGILIDKGHMHAAYFWRHASDYVIEVWNAMFYLIFHEQPAGAPKSKGIIPKRKTMVLLPEWKKKIVDILKSLAKRKV